MPHEILEILQKDIKRRKSDRQHSDTLFDIYDGNLLPHLEQRLARLFTAEQTFDEVKKFAVPINVLQKIINKLSKIYQQTVSRHVVNGTHSDQELLEWYEERLDINQMLNISNEHFNLTKTSLIEPFLDIDQRPRLRIIQSDRFHVFSTDIFDPTRPTHISVILFQEQHTNEEKKNIYITWTDTNFIIWDDSLNVRMGLMVEFAISVFEPGVNPFGRIPYVYINQSTNLLIPKHDTDLLAMTLEIPSELSFLAYAIGYQAFSIIYGIDIEDKGLKRAPNAFWSLKSDTNSETKPEIGTIKPTVDIPQVLEFIQSELAFWLNTKGIRPGTIGTVAEGFASGISKLIDESDTVEARKEQIEYYLNAEKELWDLILRHMHPVWVKNRMIDNTTIFTPTAKVVTVFAEPIPMISRKDMVVSLRSEMEAGFISRRGAMRSLNPGTTEAELDQLIKEIDDERTLEFTEAEEEEEKKEEQAEA